MIFTITSDNDEIIKTVKFQSNQSEKFGVYSRLHNQFSAINYIHLSSKINNSKKITHLNLTKNSAGLFFVKKNVIVCMHMQAIVPNINIFIISIIDQLYS